jgi:hypothetical protein
MLVDEKNTINAVVYLAPQTKVCLRKLRQLSTAVIRWNTLQRWSMIG